MSLTAYKSHIYSDATSILVFRGPANVAVQWSIASGLGAVEALSNSTDSRGVACAIYDPEGSIGQVVVRCTHGAA